MTKEERYLHMKERRRLKRKEVKKRRRALREAADREPTSTTGPTRRSMAESSCSQRIVVDCSFDELMSLKDVCKLHHQLNQCYGLNRRAANPCQLHITGVNGQLAGRFTDTDNRLASRWDIHAHEEGLCETFPADSIVYLSSESETVLERLDPDKVYVIGGLVDHNHHKGHCHRVATTAGFATARLPIERHLRLNSRCVLTVNHVFHILLLMTESHDWAASLRQVVPRRKWLCAEAEEAGKWEGDEQVGKEEGDEQVGKEEGEGAVSDDIEETEGTKDLGEGKEKEDIEEASGSGGAEDLEGN